MKRFMTVLTVVLCALMILAGCAGNSTPSATDKTEDFSAPTQSAENADTAKPQESTETKAPAAALIEPEQLLSQADAEALLGEALVGEKKEESVVGLKIMFYKATDENSNQYLQISLTQQAFFPEGSQITPESQYKNICAAFEAQPVTGLGDEAQIIPSGYQIMSDGYYLAITAGYTKDDDGNMKAASEKAVKNLKALLGK